MTNNALPARDVAFLTALAEFLLASGSDRAADAIYSVIEPHAAETQRAANDANRHIAHTG